MNKINIKSLLKRAAEATKDLPVELREKAFELAFNKMVSSSEEERPANSKLTNPPLESDGGFFAKMQQETGIKEGNLKNIFKIDKNGRLKVIAPLIGRKAEKQRALAHMYLYAKKVCFDVEWISALEFAQQTREYGINNKHVSKNLKHAETNIRQSGQKRGKEYSLTPNGTAKAKEILLDLSSQNTHE